MQTGVYDLAYSSVINATTGYMQWQGKGFWDKQSLERSFYADSTQAALIRNNPEVKDLLPRLESFALLASDESETKPGFLRGINAQVESQYFNLNEKILRGRLPLAGEAGLCVGSRLAENLKVELGDTLVIIGQGYHGMSANGKYPVIGIIDLKNPVADKSTVYLDISELQVLTGAYGQWTSGVIIPEDPKNLEELQRNLGAEIDSNTTEILTWRQMMPELIEAMN